MALPQRVGPSPPDRNEKSLVESVLTEQSGGRPQPLSVVVWLLPVARVFTERKGHTKLPYLVKHTQKRKPH
jgi:hypothetical protein